MRERKKEREIERERGRKKEKESERESLSLFLFPLPHSRSLALFLSRARARERDFFVFQPQILIFTSRLLKLTLVDAYYKDILLYLVDGTRKGNQEQSKRLFLPIFSSRFSIYGICCEGHENLNLRFQRK